MQRMLAKGVIQVQDADVGASDCAGMLNHLLFYYTSSYVPTRIVFDTATLDRLPDRLERLLTPGAWPNHSAVLRE